MEVNVLSETAQEYMGVRYYMCGAYYQRKGVRLHRKVWEDVNGPVPKGKTVHHIDGNRKNNSIGNLMLMSSSQHASHHMQGQERREIAKRNIRAAIEKAPEWHASDEGKAWHGEHAKKAWEKREEAEYICTHCGKAFKTINRYPDGGNAFCRPACRAAFRRKSGVDDEVRKCECCGAEFTANRYVPRRFCDGCKGKGRSACRKRTGL